MKQVSLGIHGNPGRDVLDRLAERSHLVYRELVHDNTELFQLFRTATPIDELANALPTFVAELRVALRSELLLANLAPEPSCLAEPREEPDEQDERP